MKPFPYIGADDHLKDFLAMVINGEYDIKQLTGFNGTPVILDIGANLGSYTYWALERFPNSIVLAFEPHAENAANYMKNLIACEAPLHRYKLIEAAVFPAETPTIDLYASTFNGGMHSIDKHLVGSLDPLSFTARVVHPRDLPNATIVKVDTEGCEIPILKSYLTTHELPMIISYEYHSVFDRFELEELMDADYILASGNIFAPTLGTMNFIHKSVVDSL